MVEVTKQNGKTNSRGTLLAMMYISSQAYGTPPVLDLKQKIKGASEGTTGKKKTKKRIESKIHNLGVNISL